MARDRWCMIRVERSVRYQLEALREQLEQSEGIHAYLFRDWHHKLGLSLSSVVQILIDRNEDHLKRGRKKRPQEAPQEAPPVSDYPTDDA